MISLLKLSYKLKMSFYYNVVEHFTAKKLPNKTFYSEGEFDAITAVAIMQRQVALLCMKTMCGDGSLNSGVDIYDFSMSIDGKVTRFSTRESNHITREVQQAILSMRSARDIRIYLNYSFEWRVSEDYLSIGPFVLAEFLEGSGDDVFEYVDFAFHNYADCSGDDSSGILAVYGKRNKEVKKGPVELLPTKTIPEFGNWTSPLSTIFLDEIMIKPGCGKQVEEICMSLMESSQHDSFELDGDLLSFTLNSALLDSKEKFEKLIQLSSELVQLLIPFGNLSPKTTAIYREFTNLTEHSLDVFAIDIRYDGEVLLFKSNGLVDK